MPYPENEAARLAALRDYRILDTAAEERFDRITRVLARSLGVPIALVSLVDDNRQWFKSRFGLDASETPREQAFCAHAICQSEVMVVEDATRDSRFADNPLVTGAPDIRFYAGAPLMVEGGHKLGTLCAIDRKPRQIDEEQKALLTDLAALVVDEMEMRRLVERAQKAETRLVDAVEALPDGFVLYDAEDRMVLCNQRYKEIYAESAPAMVPGATFEEVIRYGVAHGQYPEAAGWEEDWIAERLERHFNPGGPIEQELPGDRWLRIQERRTREGGLVGFRVDITMLKRQRREMARLAWEDCLTGALNRRRFVELAEVEMKRALRYGGAPALLLIDLDHFKRINDTHGHAAGDAVLKSVVARWREVLRESDLLGRLGGEEFAVLLPNSDEEGAASLADRLRSATAQEPVVFEGIDLPVHISVGITVCEPQSDSLENALARADAALYQAKQEGRDRCILHAA